MGETYDAVVIGAGPAGCAAGGLLSRWGHRVLLLDYPGTHDHGLAVSIPPSARRTLQAAGFLAAMEGAGLHPWSGNSVWWADDALRIECFPPGTAGYHVVRADLQRLAIRIAGHAGAGIRRARARSVQPATETDASATVRIDTSHGVDHVRARFVLDCSGRAGVIARGAGLRVLEESVRTIALTGIWHATPRWKEFDDTHTLVASYGDGWAWSIPTARGSRYVTVMVDPQRTDLSRTDSASSAYLRELRKVGPFAALLGEEPAGGPWGHDASLYSARQYAGPGYLLVGDAGSFIDPLSSFGVKKALASAWVAAVVTHTSLVKPGLRDDAVAFHDRREREVYASYRRRAAHFAASVAEYTRHTYWSARAALADPEDALEARGAAREADALSALEDLRRRNSIRLHRAPNLRTVRRAAIRGNEIALVDHFVLPGHPDGIRYLNGVDLVSLAGAAERHHSVEELFEACTQAQGTLSLPGFLGALASLIAGGALLHADPC